MPSPSSKCFLSVNLVHFAIICQGKFGLCLCRGAACFSHCFQEQKQLRHLHSPSSSILYTYLPNWVIHSWCCHSEWSTRQCAHIWTDSLQLSYTGKFEVIWDRTTYDMLVYNHQFSNKSDHWDPSSRSFWGRNLATKSGEKYHRQVRKDRKDRRDWHFQDTCVGQLSQFLRCFFARCAHYFFPSDILFMQVSKAGDNIRCSVQ